ERRRCLPMVGRQGVLASDNEADIGLGRNKLRDWDATADEREQAVATREVCGRGVDHHSADQWAEVGLRLGYPRGTLAAVKSLLRRIDASGKNVVAMKTPGMGTSKEGRAYGESRSSE